MVNIHFLRFSLSIVFLSFSLMANAGPVDKKQLEALKAMLALAVDVKNFNELPNTKILETENGLNIESFDGNYSIEIVAAHDPATPNVTLTTDAIGKILGHAKISEDSVLNFAARDAVLHSLLPGQVLFSEDSKDTSLRNAFASIRRLFIGDSALNSMLRSHGDRLSLSLVQDYAIRQLNSHLSENITRGIMILPVGIGKTRLLAHMIYNSPPAKRARSDKRDFKVMVTVHRNDLLEQNFREITGYLEAQFISEGESAAQANIHALSLVGRYYGGRGGLRELKKPILLVSTQGLAYHNKERTEPILEGLDEESDIAESMTKEESDSFFETLKSLDPNHFDAIFVDEVHRALATRFKSAIEYFASGIDVTKSSPGKPVYQKSLSGYEKTFIGLTATHAKNSGVSAKSFFDNQVIVDLTTSTVKEAGYSVPLTEKISSAGLQFQAAEKLAQEKLPKEASPSDYRVAQLLIDKKLDMFAGEIKKHLTLPSGKLRQIIAYCPDVNYARVLAAQLGQRGIAGDILYGELSETERNSVKERFTAGEFQVLYTIEMAKEGLNLPVASGAVNFTPIISKTDYIQRMGRLLRFLAGKIDAVWLEFASSYDRIDTLAEYLSRAKIAENDKVRNGSNGPKPGLIHIDTLAFEDDVTFTEDTGDLIKKIEDIIRERTFAKATDKLNTLAETIFPDGEPNLRSLAAKNLKVTAAELAQLIGNQDRFNQLSPKAQELVNKIQAAENIRQEKTADGLVGVFADPKKTKYFANWTALSQSFASRDFSIDADSLREMFESGLLNDKLKSRMVKKEREFNSIIELLKLTGKSGKKLEWYVAMISNLGLKKISGDVTTHISAASLGAFLGVDAKTVHNDILSDEFKNLIGDNERIELVLADIKSTERKKSGGASKTIASSFTLDDRLEKAAELKIDLEKYLNGQTKEFPAYLVSKQALGKYLARSVTALNIWFKEEPFITAAGADVTEIFTSLSDPNKKKEVRAEIERKRDCQLSMLGK